MARGMERESELSPIKREQILRGALATFRTLGFERASVDAIAARAKVSKATIYNHFQDKQALFLACFSADTEGLRKKFHALLETPGADIEADLRKIGTELLRLVSAPAAVQRFRLVCGEVERFPELGREFFAGSMEMGRRRLVHFFELVAASGLLEVSSDEDAAADFSGLLIHDLALKLHLGVLEKVGAEEIERQVSRSVRTFLRAYPPKARGAETTKASPAG